jgi:predicted aminopeptidase
MKFKLALFCFLLLLGLIVFINFSLVNYGFSQLYGQLKIISSTVSKNEFLNNKSCSQKERIALKNLDHILKFAKKNGFDSDKNYLKMVDSTRPKLIVASASEQFYIKPHLWSFPFLGDVPYKGFFNRKLLYNEIDFLKKGNYDIDTGQVNAYSTLGILNDPIMPEMLQLNEADLAETIFHELVHKYYFEPKKQHINESLAQAFGEKLAEKYLQKKYGHASSELKNYQVKIKKRDSLQIFFRMFALELNRFYCSQKFANSKNKKKLKQNKYRQLYAEMYKRKLTSKEKLDFLVYKIELSKNAFFSDYIVYFSNKDSLKEVLDNKFEGSFKLMINELKSKEIVK